MKRVAIVVQRYGLEINGGAELHARLLVEALRPHYEMTVLTSRALNYQMWDRHYPEGEERVDGIRVLRFDHPSRNRRSPDRRMPLLAKLRFKLRRRIGRIGLAIAGRPTGDARNDGERYLRAQGPLTEGLVEHLRTRGDDYDAFIFMTAVYYPTAFGIIAAPPRGVLVPTLHDEKAMTLPHFHRVFSAPRWIMYNTAAEQRLAHQLYGTEIAPGEVCGVGIDLPPGDPASTAAREATWAAFAARHGIDRPYLLYLGRIDPSKGCEDLFDQFRRFAPTAASPLLLVVVGQAFMPLPEDERIVYTGFVGDDERDAVIAHAAAMVIPSRYESLSLVLLEGLARGCPVLVNRQSEVLVDHVRSSGVGRAYHGYDEFAAAAAAMLALDAGERAAVAERGRRYVAENYAWPRVIAKFRRVIDGLHRPRAADAAADPA